jgi:hypothetical protein
MFIRTLSNERRRRTLRKMGFGGKFASSSAPPSTNASVLQCFPGYAKENNKSLCIIQQNEVNSLAISERVYRRSDLTDNVRSHFKSLLKIILANSGHITLQRLFLFSKHFGLPPSIFMSDGNVQVPSAKATNLTTKIVRDMVKKKKLFTPFQKNDTSIVKVTLHIAFATKSQWTTSDM